MLASGTVWQVPWELMMLGPFVSCGLLDGARIRHVTVPVMVASAVRHGTGPDAALTPCDYPTLTSFVPEMPLLDAAVLVVETGWDLAVVMDQVPRLITARSVYRALVASGVASLTPASMSPPLPPVPATGVNRSDRRPHQTGHAVDGYGPARDLHRHSAVVERPV